MSRNKVTCNTYNSYLYGTFHELGYMFLSVAAHTMVVRGDTGNFRGWLFQPRLQSSAHRRRWCKCSVCTCGILHAEAQNVNIFISHFYSSSMCQSTSQRARPASTWWSWVKTYLGLNLQTFLAEVGINFLVLSFIVMVPIKWGTWNGRQISQTTRKHTCE